MSEIKSSGTKKGRSKQVTIDEMARHLNLSKATVSLALNSSPLVAEATKTRVKRAAEELGYRPNYFATRLSKGKSDIIGLFIHGGIEQTHNWVLPSSWMFYNPILKGVTSELSENGYRLQLEVLAKKQLMDDSLIVHAIQEGALEGILFVVQDDINYDFLRIAEEMKYPLILLNGRPTGGVSSIKTNDEHGAQKAVRHLIKLGHTKIAHIRGPKNNTNADERATGFKEALSATGVPLYERYMKQGNWRLECGKEICEELMQLPDPPSAFFCANDHMAIGTIQTLQAMGIRVPEDVSVVGYDDTDMCQIVTPRLTTVRQSLEDMGKIGAREVLRQIGEGISFVSHISLEPALVVRDSTGPYRGKRQSVS